MSPLTVVLLVFLLNLPFGYWRAGVRKLSPQWFLAVHAPVPAVVALRVYAGFGFTPAGIALAVGAFFLGQYAGGWLRRAADRRR